METGTSDELDSNAVPRNSGKNKQQYEYQWSEISLVLRPYHFVGGQLTLRCVAKIPGIYERSSSVQLGTNQKEPIPARGNMQTYLETREKILPRKIVLLLKNFINGIITLVGQQDHGRFTTLGIRTT